MVGQDLNRAWADSNKFMHSEIIDIKKKMHYYDTHSKYDLGTVELFQKYSDVSKIQEIPTFSLFLPPIEGTIQQLDLDMVLDIHAHTALTGKMIATIEQLFFF